MLSSPLSWLLRSPERASRFAGAEGKPLQQGAVDARDVIAPGHALRISVIPTFRRHYAFLLHDRTSGDSAVVDPTDAGPIIGLARAQGWTIRHVIITHHHNAVGAAAIKRATRCTVHGPAAEADRIAAIDVAYQGGETFRLGNLRVDVLAVPGHTVGHLAYWFSSAGVLFCGDSMVTDAEGIHGSRPGLTWNEEKARESERRQAALGAHIVCSGHGPVVMEAAGKFPVS